jgi:hypothetical protein
MIISSSFAVGVAQDDGRTWVTETRNADDGSVIVSSYLADQGADYQAHLDLMVEADNTSLAQQAEGS